MNSKELLSEIAANLERIASERNSLKNLVQEKDNEIETLNERISDLSAALENQTKIDSNNLQSNNHNSENNELKLKIDGLVEEIDECLALLNN